MLNAGGGSYIEKKKACGFTAHNAPTTITRGWEAGRRPQGLGSWVQ